MFLNYPSIQENEEVKHSPTNADHSGKGMGQFKLVLPAVPYYFLANKCQSPGDLIASFTSAIEVYCVLG